MATNNKPAYQLRCGNIKATICQNVSEKGKISAVHGAIVLRSVSMTLRRSSALRVKPRSGSPLTP